MSYDYIGTYMGHELNLKHPCEKDIDLYDIAYVLSRINRFGHSIPYTVAQHSLLVYELVRQKSDKIEEHLSALLHDSAEAYIGDLQTPIKDLIQVKSADNNPFKELEKKIEQAIANKYRFLSKTEGFKSKLVEEADRLAWRLEAYTFLRPCVNYPNWDIKELPKELEEYSYTTPTIENPDLVESDFLRTFDYLVDRYNEYIELCFGNVNGDGGGYDLKDILKPPKPLSEEAYVYIWDRGKQIGRLRKLKQPTHSGYALEILDGSEYVTATSKIFMWDDFKYLGFLKDMVRKFI